MSPERYASWVDHAITGFAADKVSAGNWPVEGSIQRATDEFHSLLPEGMATAGHDVLAGIADGEEVGILWLFTDPALTPRESYIYDIEVAAEQRGKGYGRGLLEAGERWCAEQQVTILKLHVFGFNTSAINLYESSGFEVTNLDMAKRIPPL
jgi:ribosomal protein S18 acetylase RimI-like enzyme